MNTPELRELVDHLVDIGCALSSERDLDRLLEMIVDEARRFTGADGGTLFLVDDARRKLCWQIVQNDSMGIRKGGAGGQPLESEAFADIALYDADGQPVHSNVATHVFHAGQPVHIADVYDDPASATDAFDFEGPKRFDQQTGYRTRSMLVVPLVHHGGGAIGVLQLINATGPDGQPRPFAAELEGLTRSLAGQAAVAVRNAELFTALERQFEAFIKTIAMAIDEKSSYTAGHVRRVVDITMRLARAVSQADRGPYADVTFSREQLKAIRVAAWMHDIGKVTTPEYVVDKPTKLSTIFDRIELVRQRFEKTEALARVEALERKLDRALGALDAPPDFSDIDAELDARRAELADDLAFVEQANRGTEYMGDADVARVEAIAERSHRRGGEPLLTDDEVENLQIRRGTLTTAERDIIRDHARVSLEMLTSLPFTSHLSEVPEIAASHHEKLNGQGYPRGLSADELSLPARILAVADIFEALTAADRPYKEPTPLSGALRILGFMVDDGELDGELVRFALDSGVLDAYAADEVAEAQRDVVLADAASGRD